MNKLKNFLFLFLILLIGFWFRFNNVNWDENFHLHPDERFLTMVGNAMTLPKNIGEYLNPIISKINPANIGYKFFVYGNFPLVLNKYLAVFYHKDNYNDFTILGRKLSAYLDLLIILFVFKTVFLLEKRYKFSSSLKYLAAFFYAIAVYPIQSSHFFTVDTFLNFFMFASFYLALKYYLKNNIRHLFLSSIFFGLALASKVSAIYILPLILFFIFFKNPKKTSHILLFLVILYLSLRLANPYYFQNSSLFDPRLNQDFVSSIKQLKSFEGKDIWYPPAVQWMNKPVSFLLVNLMFIGVGLPYFILMFIGIVWIILNLKSQIPACRQAGSNPHLKSKNYLLMIILIWVVGYFIYQSVSVFKSIRYTIYLYPFFAIFAGIGANVILNSFQDLRFRNKFGMTLVTIFLLVILLVWPLMFSSIYLNKHTRVEASEWIYKNLPSGSSILSEAWDDGLPLPIVNNYEKQFTGEQLPVFDPDTPEKWQKMNKMLAKADYYILSSNRGWGSISTVPEKYPKMSKFYKELLADKNPLYKKIKQFDPYYYRFFSLPNNWVEETFTVYDHPQVMIYENVKRQ
ncbi:hypothetical protein COY13_01660 [Candidatus Roizmanbacteria bacterium CG_4_10_14_0_2_um_filter_36_35]|uniref:Glycosyltransferase RgtA/B/C/D-like domain-containing protein n=4 Tax=Candidatus Roizmaniibacteriota TaxID=1752723 RepID=A0A2M7BWM4_9BACT|nr:MAG: hypothetical protein COV86_03770 [Candidatus Roizmanbacteria bacterium CG11_big_fil_rev_8_21_14_0_20_35_14]PIV10977.1 MAG: hypothetical protein COS50_02535 [Candidatus Roizmanbacteria bacterium CG03_land_8_20_14_0_80_35_26]PIZ68208.1 MAG: hypothetical protein COY13_01660 [Candidatus Roizmanbacteria bacterium CG_4_10_14_0_2_um_filter_36_35]PJC31002.1 MAG: hypothetical protein CO049_04685 [Candidatus Roizmanbacteria bacterium CG_4_9_14_0_2_um_filter_36_12]PJC79897.1 MAG: hypothetical prot